MTRHSALHTSRPGEAVFNRRRFLSAAGALAGAGIFGLPSRRSHAAAQKISLLYGANSALYAPTMAAAAWFNGKDGTEIAPIAVDGGSRVRQALAAGQAPFAHGDTSHPLQLTNRGKACRILLATEVRASYANIVVRRELHEQGIDTVEKLAAWRRPNGGKPVIAATAIGSGTWLYGSYLFESIGKGNAVTWANGGNTGTLLGGLQSGQFDAVAALPGVLLDAEAHNWGRAIYDTRDPNAWNAAFGGNIPTMVIYALASTVEAEPELTQACIDVIYQTLQRLKSSSVDDVHALLSRRFLGDLDPESAKQEIAYYTKSWHYSGEIKTEDFANGGKVWFRGGTDIAPISFSDVVDTRFLENARRKFG